jgi:hypothetical protein
LGDTTGSSAWEKRANAKAAIEKKEALKRMLGYNAASALQLSRAEIRSLTKAWMRKSGAVGDSRNTSPGEVGELYHKLVGLKVCNSDTIIGCLAYYWKTIVKVIREADDEYHNTSGKDGVYMMLFPYCKDLYTYDKLSMVNSAIDLGQDLCQHLGADFSLTMFHPKYKNAPTMFSPQRHSPFPTAGLQFSSSSKKRLAPEDTSRFVDNQRIHLEHLFNSAAASEMRDIDTNTDDQVSSLPYYSTDEVVDRTKEWFEEGVGSDKYGNTLDDKWFVSTATMAEEAYADIWSIIHDLSKQQHQGSGVMRSVLMAPRFSTFNAPQWRQFAITVNAVLKRMTNGKIFLEVFHPEYTSKNNNGDMLRRSPFPTIQICRKP